MIAKFTGKFRFLSNFYPCIVHLPDEDYDYPSVEHAYQAAKFPVQMRGLFRSLGPDEAAAAKRMGKGKAPKDWKQKNLDLMMNLIREKFQEPRLRDQLLETGHHGLIETNWWGDTFFGVSNGIGENYLGRMLMAVRAELRGGPRFDWKTQGGSK